MRRTAKTRCGGGLRHRMTITKPTTPTDGETKPTWSNVATGVACLREYRRGSEVQSGNRVLDTADYVITWRYRGDVLPTYRLTIGTNVHEIITLGDRTGEGQWEEARCNLLAST